MSKQEDLPPWATGPSEILKHGMNLLKQDSDVNRRLAMISIDNAVELMIKTYLGLPKRITGLEIRRKDFDDFSHSFPKLLDAIEKHAADKLEGIDLGEIEWYHRLRNELYHQGNGLTVERDKVEVYSELANLLFDNLYGFRLIEPEDDETKLLGDFMSAWIDFEKVLADFAAGVNIKRIPLDALRHLEEAEVITRIEFGDINDIRRIRNSIVHGTIDHKSVITEPLIKKLRELTQRVQLRLKR